MKKLTLFVALVMMSTTMFAQVLVEGVIADKTLPTGWTYITNNDQYPDAAFYSDGGLKLNFEGQGILSPAFEAQSAVKVSLTINALNENTKTATSEDVFTYYGLNASGETVATTAVKDANANVATITGEGIVQVKVIMTGYPHNGNKYCNVNLGGVKIEAAATGLENIEAAELDVNAPMYNVLGQQVGTEYKGVVIQNGQKFLVK